MPNYETLEERPLHAKTIEYLRKELSMYNFDDEIIYALWHRLNGREAEAESYTASFQARQRAMRDLMVPDIKDTDGDKKPAASK